MKYNGLPRKMLRRTRGTMLVLVAVTLTALMAFAALAVDLGVITVAYSQLQTVADSAALAGARQLATDNRLSPTYTVITTEMNAARAKARSIGQANYVLSRAAVINDNPSNTSTGDVVIGNLNPLDTSSTLTFATQLNFNSVKVNAIRSSDHSGIVPAFFSRALGIGGSTISVTSTATVDLYQASGFDGTGTANAAVLPIVMAQTSYTAMMNGTTGDSYTFTPGNYTYPLANNASTGVTSAADGIHESTIYPVSGGESGNWGTINFGVGNNSTKTLGDQIEQGITPAQMQSEFPGGTVTFPHQFSANPGLSAGIKDNLENIIGKPVALPIYDTSGGNGNNAWYHVVAYASVRIVAVNLTGGNKYVIVQPALNSDPTVIPNLNSRNSFTQGGVPVVHLSR